MLLKLLLSALYAQYGGPPAEPMYGEEMDNDKAPEAISKAVASLPPEQMFQLMRQMKTCIQNNPSEARNLLLQNPQLAYALLQAQVIMKIVDPQVALVSQWNEIFMKFVEVVKHTSKTKRLSWLYFSLNFLSSAFAEILNLFLLEFMPL